MVLWSTPKSIENRNVSVLAIVEIIMAVALYWWVAYSYDTYWHILASILITPFLLFRSEQSINLTLDLIDKGIRKRKPISKKIELFIMSMLTNILLGLWIFSVSVITMFVTDNIVLNLTLALLVSFFFLGLMISAGTYLSVKTFVRLSSSDKNSFYMLIITVSIAMVSLYPFIGLVYSIFVPIIVTIIQGLLIYLIIDFKEKSILYNLTHPPLLLLLSVGGIFGSLVILMVYRVVSTIIFIKYGYKKFLSNWRESMLVKDMKSLPEIVPGIESFESHMVDMLKLSSISFEFKKEIKFSHFDQLLNT